MSKRPASPALNFFEITNGGSEKAFLRVREACANGWGSMMLMTESGGVYDCVKCDQEIRTRFTEKHWVERYDDIFGFDDDALKRDMIADNKNKAYFLYERPNKKTWSVNIERCVLTKEKLWEGAAISHCVWSKEGKYVELQLKKDID